MAAFNFNAPLPQYNPLAQGTLQQASRSPFEIAGKAMSGLEEAIDNRAFVKDLSGVEDLQGLSQLNPTTAKQIALAKARQGQFTALDQQALRDAQLEKAQFDLGQREQAQGALNVDKQYLQNIGSLPQTSQAVEGLPSLANQIDAPTGQFNAIQPLSVVDKINAEKVLGQTGTFDLLKLNDAKEAARLKATTGLSKQKRDRLRQSEVAFYAGNPNPSAEQVQKFYNDWTTQDLGGKGSVRDETDVVEIVAAKNMGKGIIAGENVDDYSTRAGTEAAYKQTDAYTAQVEKAEAGFYQADNTIKSTTALATALKSAIDSDNFDSGMMASLQKNIGNLGTEGFWRSISGKSTEQIMSQAGLEGSIGIEVAERLRDMSGLAASDNEFGRTLAQVIGGDWTQEDVKLNVINNFIEKITNKNKRVGERLIRNGLVGDVADVYNGYGKKDKPSLQSLGF